MAEWKNGADIPQEDAEWLALVSEKIKAKERVVAARSRNKIPYTTDNGSFDDWTDRDICWWTNGFWGGMMWQLFHATGDTLYKEIAEEAEEKLDSNLMRSQGMDHDSGFKWLTTAAAHYRKDGDPAAKNRAMLAADNLAGRFNPAGRFIRAWNDSGDGSRAGWAIIDCMMNLPLLYWAYEETRDPRYYHIAVMHADTAEKYFIRPDGSANHIVEFDPVSGDYIRSMGGQGVKEGSSWTRGQAWALYGFVLSYLHTKEERYLYTAKRVANYFIASLPESNLVPVDFRQPSDCTWEDSTAAAIAACGMLEISKCVKEEEQHVYYRAAIRLLKTLAEKRCRFDTDCDNLLEKCTAAYHDKEHEFSIIYGDYFFIEAIWKLTGQELFLW